MIECILCGKIIIQNDKPIPFRFKGKKFSQSTNLGQYGEFSEKKGIIALRINNIKQLEALHIAHDGKRLIINIIRPNSNYRV